LKLTKNQCVDLTGPQASDTKEIAMATTGSSQTSQDKGAGKIKKGAAPRIQRDNDTDNERNRATHQESRDRNEHRHFHAADAQDIERSQSSARAQKREKGWEDNDGGREDRFAGPERERKYNHSDTSHYNDDNRTYQSFTASGGNRSGSGRTNGRYEQMGHGANRRPDDSRGDPVDEVDRRYLSDDRANEPDWRRREDDRGHYDGNRAERDRYELNDRQNGWQANARIDHYGVDNRGDERRHPDDSRFQNNWRDRQWRETAYRGGHEWRPNDDWRNEQRNGSEYDRDRDSYGNSRFRDDDYGYRASRHEERDYGREDDRNDPRQPRGYTATSERDFDDRNPSREWGRDRSHTSRGRHR
jgi:hypothetical protein